MFHPMGIASNTQNNTLQSLHRPKPYFTNKSIKNAQASFLLFFNNEAMTGAKFRPGGVC